MKYGSENKKSNLYLIYFIVFLDILGFGIIIPIIRDITIFLSEKSKLTMEPVTLSGILMSSYSLAQFIFAPILGRLSDIYGRKKLLFISVFGNVISYFMWMISQTYEFFLVSRLISGMTGGNISIAQSYLADITDKKERASAMGMFGAVFGIGFVLGPFFGSILIGYDMSNFNQIYKYLHPFSSIGAACAMLSFLNLILIVFNLPESLPKSLRFRKKSWKSLYSWDIMKLKSRLNLINLFSISFFVSISFVLLEATLAWDLLIKFNLNTKETGFYFAGMGLFMAAIQGGLYPKLQAKVPLHSLIKNNLLLLGTMVLFLPLAHNIIIFSLLLYMVVFSISVLNPSISLQTSLMSDESTQGIHLGMLQSLNSLARSLIPFLATLSYGYISPILPLFVAALSAMVAYFFAVRLKKITL